MSNGDDTREPAPFNDPAGGAFPNLSIPVPDFSAFNPPQDAIATPTFSGQPLPGGVQTPSAKAQDMLKAIAQIAARKRMANIAIPSPVPGGADPNAARHIGMDTSWPHAWGFQRFAAGLSANIKNAVAKQKEDQLLKAEGDWSYAQSAMNELFDAQQSGDQNAIAAAQKKVDAAFGDPKKLKNMAKALNQDWLNPEKTTVYGEALKRTMENQKQQDAQRQSKLKAAQGLKAIFQKLIGQRQQPQLTDEEKQRMAREIEGKAPVVREGMDAATAREILKEEAQAEREAARDKATAEREEAKEAAQLKRDEQKEQDRREDEETKAKFQRERDRMNNEVRERMQTARDSAAAERQAAHDLRMMELWGMKLDAQQKKAYEKTPKERETELQGTITDLSKQLAQAQTNLRSLKNSAANHWIKGPGKDEIESAESQIDDLQKGLAYLEKNRDAVIKGEKPYGEVVEKAYSIMGGEGTDEFVPDKK